MSSLVSTGIIGGILGPVDQLCQPLLLVSEYHYQYTFGLVDVTLLFLLVLTCLLLSRCIFEAMKSFLIVSGETASSSMGCEMTLISRPWLPLGYGHVVLEFRLTLVTFI